MGWDFTFRAPGQKHLTWFRDHVYGDNLLDVASVGTVLYGAVRWEGEVHGTVILTRRAPKSEWNYGYKTVPETWGPYEYDCPERILDLLTPTTDEAALAWRAKCRENIAKRKANPRVSKGVTVHFTAPITFSSGAALDTFEFVKGTTFRIGWQLYRISDWRKREYELVVA